jgi:hypothetical protein
MNYYNKYIIYLNKYNNLKKEQIKKYNFEKTYINGISIHENKDCKLSQSSIKYEAAKNYKKKIRNLKNKDCKLSCLSINPNPNPNPNLNPHHRLD